MSQETSTALAQWFSLWAKVVSNALAVNKTYLDTLLEIHGKEDRVSAVAGTTTVIVAAQPKAMTLCCSDLVLQNTNRVLTGAEITVDPLDLPGATSSEVTVHVKSVPKDTPSGNHRGHLVNVADGSRVGNLFWVLISVPGT